MKKLFVILITLFSSSLFLFGQSPGGVSSQLLGWWKADAGVSGVSNVTQWQDQSPKGNNLAATTGPSLVNVDINYNPAMDFNGANSTMSVINGLMGTQYHDDVFISVVSMTNKTQNGTVFYETMDDSEALSASIGWSNKQVYFDYGPCCSTSRVNGNWQTQTGVYHLWTFGSSTTTGTPSGTRKAIYRDGAELYTNNKNETAKGLNANFYIGSDGNSSYHDGNISEFVIWNGVPTAVELQKVHSYLALKYSLSLESDNNNNGVDFESTNTDGIHEGDYLNTSGTVVWDASQNTAYHNDIIGIARDDAQTLLQKQSRTQDDVTRVYLDQLMATNALNTGTFGSDLQYLVVGHDQGAMCTAAATDNEKPVGFDNRLQREWKVTNTNFDGVFNIDWALDNCPIFEGADLNDMKLLVDADGDFSNASAYGTDAGLTFSINNGRVTVEGISTTIIPVGSTLYITLALGNPAPLPIDLVSFNATAESQYSVIVEWVTETEVNNDYFSIERSTDGQYWNAIHRVMGAGNTTIKQYYETFDNEPLPGISYYRLKQTDFDGRYTYSHMVTVKIETQERIELNIFPNPAQNQITIEADPAELENLRIFDLLGRDVSAMVYFNQIAPSRVSAEIGELVPGAYMVVMKTGTHMISKQ